MCVANPFLKGELHLQLALFIINCYPPYWRPQGGYIINNESCSLCNSEQAVNITFLYNGIGTHSTQTGVYCTTLDGWNLLNYSNAQVEFRNCSGIPQPLEHADNPIIGFFEDEYLHPEVQGHELIYKCIMSGLDLKGIYDNIKKNSTRPIFRAVPNKPPVGLKIETIIIFSLEGAKTLFAMIEDPCVILSFNQAIYDPRQGQTGITTPRPSPIFWGDINFTLTRTIQNPSCLHARTLWTIYHLDQSYTWKRVKSYTTQGFGGRSCTTLEVMALGDTHPVKPFNAGDKVIRTITTQDTFIPCHLVPI